MSFRRKAPHIQGYKTRVETAIFIGGVTKQAVYFWEKCGKLKPIVLAGCVYYADSDVQAFKDAYVPVEKHPARGKKHQPILGPTALQAKQGPLAKAVLKCLHAEKDLTQTVIATGAHPEFVREMWLQMRTGFHAREYEKKKQAEERLVVKLSNERMKKRRLEHLEEMSRIQRGG
jgi:hypothetical protein